MKLTWTLVLMTMAAISLTSCLDDDDNEYSTIFPSAIVTLKNNSTDGTFYMQLDDSTTLVPINMKQSPYGDKEVRAFVNFSQEITSQRNQTYDVHVNWIDSIRTKGMDINLGKENNIATYGNYPLEIVNDWITSVEDGYLTLHFQTKFGMGNIHYLRLVKGENPYELTLYHNADEDSHSQMADGYIAFSLEDLPDVDEEGVDLILKWNSFSGEKSAKFRYHTHN